VTARPKRGTRLILINIGILEWILPSIHALSPATSDRIKCAIYGYGRRSALLINIQTKRASTNSDASQPS